MSQISRLIILAGFAMWAVPSFGQKSCLPGFTALQTVETADPSAPSAFIRPLVSRRADADFVTRVRLEGAVTSFKGGSLQLKVQFDPAFDGVSLPYNLFAVLVIADGEILAWYDYTNGCAGPGLSFFPGRAVDLPLIKLVGGKSQKLQIMVWGRL